MPLEFQLLGPIEARDEGRSLALSGPRRKALLARLLLDHGRVVTSDQLVDDVWDGRPGPGAAATLQSHISQLRKVLGDRLRSRGGGYLLDLTDAVLDVDDFERLADAGAARCARSARVSRSSRTLPAFYVGWASMPTSPATASAGPTPNSSVLTERSFSRWRTRSKSVACTAPTCSKCWSTRCRPS